MNRARRVLAVGRAAAFAALAAAAAVVSESAAAEPAADPVAAHLIDTLGVPVASQAVRERPGWRRPQVVVVSHRLASLVPQLQEVASKVILVDVETATPREIGRADAAIGVCTPELLAQAKQIEWIQWPAAGVERCLQQPAVRERHLLLTNLQRTAGPSMAEHVIAMMFVLSRHLDWFLNEQQQGRWTRADDAPRLADLDGKTVLVVGLGGIGTEVARRAHALGMHVTATRASGHTGPDFVSYVGLPDELGRLAKEADFVVNCTPLTPQTTGIFNSELFAAMKPTAYFLSVGRGRSTVTSDLIAALKDGRIAGAGLDVVDPEPLPGDSPLWHLPNVIITPHVSANTPLAEGERNTLLRENLRRYVAGEPMLAVVDPERGY